MKIDMTLMVIEILVMSWSHNKGEFEFEDFNLVNCVSIE